MRQDRGGRICGEPFRGMTSDSSRVHGPRQRHDHSWAGMLLASQAVAEGILAALREIDFKSSGVALHSDPSGDLRP